MVTWSKDSQVLSADNVKVLMDSRLRVHYSPLGGVNISIRQDYQTDLPPLPHSEFVQQPAWLGLWVLPVYTQL